MRQIIRVYDGYRGIGIGNALIRDVLKKAKGRWNVVVLEVFGNNRAAMRLYKGNGFRIYGVLPRGIRSGRRYVDSILMYKRVGGS